MRGMVIAALILTGCSEAPQKQAFAQCLMQSKTEAPREPISGAPEDLARFMRLCMATKGFEESGRCEEWRSPLTDVCYRQMK